MDYIVCGVGPLDNNIVVFGCAKGPNGMSVGERPSLQVIQPAPEGFADLGIDFLSLRGFAKYTASDYSLVFRRAGSQKYQRMPSISFGSCQIVRRFCQGQTSGVFEEERPLPDSGGVGYLSTAKVPRGNCPPIGRMGTNVDPRILVERINFSEDIPMLKESLAKMMHDYSLQVCQTHNQTNSETEFQSHSQTHNETETQSCFQFAEFDFEFDFVSFWFIVSLTQSSFSM
ncbi:unnamed protein product [Nesidiocoris tenuis]|uniref:Uncharacterized protein n=1 Tax=Nesidiocoris tenuis TaxID=355587 RepID=A0A6H5HFY0_9HEMI|nr:unnamed protein product [Nesidiocoris tenuis]